MFCLSRMCYLCLREKNNLTIINSLCSDNEELLGIMNDFAFNLGWMITRSNILICEGCCVRLRETYQFVSMCRENSKTLRGYVSILEKSLISEKQLGAELKVMLMAITKIKCDVKEDKIEDNQQISEEASNLLGIKDEIICKDEVVEYQEELQSTNYNEDESILISNQKCEVIEDDIEDNQQFTEEATNLLDIKDEIICKDEVVEEQEELQSTNYNVDKSNLISNNFKATENNISNDDTDSSFTNDKVFSSNVQESNTDRNCSGKKPNECSVCNKLCKTKESLSIHMRIHTATPHKCPTCNFQGSRKSHIENHIRTHTGEKPYKCSKCRWRFTQKSNLTTHMRTHTKEKPYVCVTCGANFVRKSELVRHSIIHALGISYKCSICNACFRTKLNLDEHVQVHTGENPYKCLSCSACFSLDLYLETHKQIHNGIKPYKCLVCNYSCIYKSAVDIHLRTHTGERPYNCSTCNKSFITVGNLKTHMLIHTGDKLYECPTCNYGSNKKSNLLSHKCKYLDQ